MEKLKLYEVKKSSSNKQINVGDLIWISKNGDLNSVQGCGWLSKEEWDIPGMNDFEVEECKTHYLDVCKGHERVRVKEK